METVRLTKSYGPYQAGQLLTLPTDEATRYEALGVGCKVSKDAAPSPMGKPFHVASYMTKAARGE